MLRFLVLRVIQSVPVLLGVSFLVFLSIYLLPGDVTLQILGLGVTEQGVLALRRELGLDEALPVQFIIWLGRLLGGDLGQSHIMREPVMAILAGKAANSFILMLSSLVLVVAGGTLLAATSAACRDSFYDRCVVALCFFMASAPVFWLGVVLVIFFAVHLHWLPMGGMMNIADPGGLGDLLAHLVLPTVTTAATSLAIVTRVVRSAMIDALNQPYVVAARARGFSERSIVFRHALRNVLPTLANICGLQVGYLFGSSVFSEIIFAWPGIGLQLYTSIIARDGPMVQGCVLVVAIAFVTGNIVADAVVYALDVHRKR